MSNETIKNIILDYCEGKEHLEFSYSDLDKIAERIKALVVNTVIEDSEHLDDARNNINYL